MWAGNLGELKKIGRVSVPKYCWKVIYIKNERKFRAFIFENNTTKPDGFLNNEVKLEEVKKITGFDFTKLI